MQIMLLYMNLKLYIYFYNMIVVYYSFIISYHCVFIIFIETKNKKQIKREKWMILYCFKFF